MPKSILEQLEAEKKEQNTTTSATNTSSLTAKPDADRKGIPACWF